MEAWDATYGGEGLLRKKWGAGAVLEKRYKCEIAGLLSRYHLDTEMTEADGFVWHFTGIYGEPKMDEKDKTWKLMRNLKVRNSKPWLCAGDFNEVLYSWEKEGGAPRSQACMDHFKMALEDCELDDLGYAGDTFTWRKHSHEADSYIRERIDRAIAMQSWRDRFPSFKVTNGEPLVIQTIDQ